MAYRVAGPHSPGFIPMVKHERMRIQVSSTQSTGAKAFYSGMKLQPQIKRAVARCYLTVLLIVQDKVLQ